MCLHFDQALEIINPAIALDALKLQITSTQHYGFNFRSTMVVIGAKQTCCFSSKLKILTTHMHAIVLPNVCFCAQTCKPTHVYIDACVHWSMVNQDKKINWHTKTCDE